MAHSARGSVNRMGTMRSAETRKSSAAISAVVVTMTAARRLRFPGDSQCPRHGSASVDPEPTRTGRHGAQPSRSCASAPVPGRSSAFNVCSCCRRGASSPRPHGSTPAPLGSRAQRRPHERRPRVGALPFPDTQVRLECAGLEFVGPIPSIERRARHLRSSRRHVVRSIPRPKPGVGRLNAFIGPVSALALPANLAGRPARDLGVAPAIVRQASLPGRARIILPPPMPRPRSSMRPLAGPRRPLPVLAGAGAACLSLSLACAAALPAPESSSLYGSMPASDDGCGPAQTRIEHLDEPTALGFSAVEVLNRVAGSRSVPLYWLEPVSNQEMSLLPGPSAAARRSSWQSWRAKALSFTAIGRR